MEYDQEVTKLIMSEVANAIPKLLQSCVIKTKLVADSEFQTVVNAVKLDAQADLIEAVIMKIQEIRNNTNVETSS